MILALVNITGADGLVRQGATMGWNQNIPGQDTKANTIAADAVAVAPCLLVVNTFLIEHKDLIILHSQYHGCRWPGKTVIHFLVSVSRSDSEIQIYLYVLKWIQHNKKCEFYVCLAYQSIQQTILLKVFYF